MTFLIFLVAIIVIYVVWRVWLLPHVPRPARSVLGCVNEVTWILILSNLSLFVLAIVVVGKDSALNFGIPIIAKQFYASFEAGELFVYLCTLLAPVLYMAATNYRAARHYSLLGVLFVAQLILLLGSALIYSLHGTGTLENHGFAADFASVVYPLALLIWAVSIFYRRLVLDNAGADVSTRMRKSSRDRKASVNKLFGEEGVSDD